MHWRTANYLSGRTFLSNFKVGRQQASATLRFQDDILKGMAMRIRPRDLIMNLIKPRRNRGDGHNACLGRAIRSIAPIRQFLIPRFPTAPCTILWIHLEYTYDNIVPIERAV